MGVFLLNLTVPRSELGNKPIVNQNVYTQSPVESRRVVIR